MATNLSQPQPLELTGNLAENWKRFKQRFELYNVASGMSKTEEKAQTSMLLHVIGEEALDIYNTFQFEEDTGDEMKLEKVLKKFENYCMPKRNVTFERHKFFTRSQHKNETTDQYATELRNRAKSCDFGDLKDSLIRDRIICGIVNSMVRERLLRQDDLTLDKTLQLCRSAETTRAQAKELSSTDEVSVDALGSRRKLFHGNQRQNPRQSLGQQQTQRPYRSQNQTQGQKSRNSCGRCGNWHGQNACPAQGQICKKCGLGNHFAKCCKTPMSKVINEMQNLEVEDEFMVDVVETLESRDEWKVKLVVNSRPVIFKLDTGAQTNLLPESVYQSLIPRPKLHPARVRLTGYSGVVIPVKGRCYVQVEYKGLTHNMAVLVTPGDRQPLLGLQACEQLKLVKRVLNVKTESKNVIVDDYEDVFEGLGCVPGKHHITLKENAQPVQHACRKIPFPLRNQLKDELDKMERLKVITPVDEPSDWVSSLVVVMKKNNQLRVCLDPRDLNRSIKREHYQLPSREEITAQFAGAKYFSKLDASSGFWQIELDEESSRLCTFITPFGRYRFLRLPFGVCSAPEVFHKVVHNLFAHIPGVNTMMDDIVVWGSTQQEHDTRLKQVLDIAQKANLKLNRDKCEFNVSQMTFIGDVISEQGVQPDPKKVAAILNMERPQNKQDVQRFLGMVNYQGKFIPDLSTKSAPLRSLLEKRNEWMWQDAQEKAWCQLKEALTQEPVLHFYDSTKPTKLSADASKNGLGAVLLQQHDQNWFPIAYASRAMTDAETRYAQIEKELLAMTSACERFHQYIHGRQVEVETDHKPLVPLFKKSLCDCPLRIQRLLIRVQRYDLKVSYTPGKYMYTADALSRAVDPQADMQVEREEDIRIYVDTIMETLPVTSNRKSQFVDETQKDKTLQELIGIIKDGWPETKQQCPVAIRAYWNIRNELSEAEGLIMKGSRIVVPSTMKKQMLDKIHEGHLGIEKCKRRAREVLYWPRINQDITEMVQNCNSCLMYKPKQQTESLKPHTVPNRPWEKIAADLFTLNNKDYMVIVDYYSQFIEVCPLSTTTSKTVITKMKEVFSRQGTPSELVTDNGPQLASKEFKNFAQDWDFCHTTTSPYHPQSNGLAENAVKIVKNLIRKCQDSRQDVYRALQVYRSSPLECGKSPAELLYNRRLRSNLPMVDKLLDPQHINPQQVRERKEGQKVKQKERYDKHARDLPELNIGQTVRLQNMHNNRWSQSGIVKVKLPNRSYLVETEYGEIRRRNRRHLRPAPTRRDDRFQQTTQTDSDPDDEDVSEPTPERSGVPAQQASSYMTTRSGRISKPPNRMDL
ncbi:uncharacterized protein K02A2.6-like [Strongylocentrotus purpuratus]|uniref:Endonuclease n=2 Tax=Strongylocentrotus purpuratus TaxID=7668 RepID=A0A7M7PH42_STRPU|nr:uncharacterized protein K02A2.6-like [Strongylocentrotus purpuratus]